MTATGLCIALAGGLIYYLPRSAGDYIDYPAAVLWTGPNVKSGAVVVGERLRYTGPLPITITRVDLLVATPAGTATLPATYEASNGGGTWDGVPPHAKAISKAWRMHSSDSRVIFFEIPVGSSPVAEPRRVGDAVRIHYSLWGISRVKVIPVTYHVGSRP